MDTPDWFNNWFNSHYYHLLYNNRDVNEANNFISELIKKIQPTPNSKILDVACGRGRHSKILADEGFDATGIDLSVESILEAKKSEAENLHFFVHDMRLPFYINYFDIVINIFTSFGYFKTQREHNNAIRTMAQSLRRNGILVIDYLNVHFEEKNKVSVTEKTIEDIKFIITKWQTDTHFLKQIQSVNNNTGLPRHLSTERVAKFSLGDFNEMLSYQGMQIQNVYGDYSFNEYNLNDSPRMIIIAKKV